MFVCSRCTHREPPRRSIKPTLKITPVHARVVLASGTFNYDPRDDADVVRIARLIADEPEVASIDHDDLRTALASVRNGSTFTF